tara:strand:+ start:909 stop:1136 length:228 start_codon:yes stop_codon:yes gene_type:complete
MLTTDEIEDGERFLSQGDGLPDLLKTGPIIPSRVGKPLTVYLGPMVHRLDDHMPYFTTPKPFSFERAVQTAIKYL